MIDDSESYRLARFATPAEAEAALHALREAGIDCRIVPESPDVSGADAGWNPVHLVCTLEDRIQAIVTLERARVI